jgi:hypothetical protein
MLNLATRNTTTATCHVRVILATRLQQTTRFEIKEGDSDSGGQRFWLRGYSKPPALRSRKGTAILATRLQQTTRFEIKEGDSDYPEQAQD